MKTLVETAGGKQDLASRIAWWSIVAALLCVPLTVPTLVPIGLGSLMNDPFSLSKLVALRVITLVGLGAWGFGLLSRGGRIRHTPIDWLVLWSSLKTLRMMLQGSALTMRLICADSS